MSQRIKCPHCDHTYNDEDMHKSANDLWAAAPDENGVKETCVSCGETFFIEGGYIPKYKTFKTEKEWENG